MSNYIEIKPVTALRSFQVKGIPEILHVLKTGFEDQYALISDSAHDTEYLGVYSQAEILELYEIDLSKEALPTYQQPEPNELSF